VLLWILGETVPGSDFCHRWMLVYGFCDEEGSMEDQNSSFWLIVVWSLGYLHFNPRICIRDQFSPQT
jgi:hypothetical protein